MKRLFLLAALAVLACATTAPAETAHNLLQQNNRTLAPYDLSVIPELLKSNANVFFVDNEATEASDTADGIHGETPDRPFKTYDFAIGQCTAGQNNIIVIMPYSTEHYTAAGSVDVDVTGITTIGLGYGPARPKFVFDHAAATFVVGRTGDGATFANLTFQASVTGVTVGVQVEDGADNISCVDCEWLNGELVGTDEFLTAVDFVTEANDVDFERCRWTSSSAGAVCAIDIGDGAVAGFTLRDCSFYGDYSTSDISSDQALTRVLIKDCDFYNANGGEPLLEFQGTANVGTVRGCTFVNDGTANDMGGISLVGNVSKNSGDSNTDGLSYSLADDGITAAKIGVGAIEADAFAAGAVTAAALAADASVEIWNNSIAAYSGAGYAGTYLKTLYDDWLNAGRLDTILDTINTTTAAFTGPKVVSKSITTIANGSNTLWTIAGGPIRVIEICGYVTTQIGSEGCLIGLNCNPGTPATDTAFGTDGTALECNAAAVGSLLSWQGVIAADLVKVTNGVGLGHSGAGRLIVPAGTMEMVAAHDGTCAGAITWYMEYEALASGVTVTP
jgi:hypothetical protein